MVNATAANAFNDNFQGGYRLGLTAIDARERREERAERNKDRQEARDDRAHARKIRDLTTKFDAEIYGAAEPGDGGTKSLLSDTQATLKRVHAARVNSEYAPIAAHIDKTARGMAGTLPAIKKQLYGEFLETAKGDIDTFRTASKHEDRVNAFAAALTKLPNGHEYSGKYEGGKYIIMDEAGNTKALMPEQANESFLLMTSSPERAIQLTQASIVSEMDAAKAAEIKKADRRYEEGQALQKEGRADERTLKSDQPTHVANALKAYDDSKRDLGLPIDPAERMAVEQQAIETARGMPGWALGSQSGLASAASNGPRAGDIIDVEGPETPPPVPADQPAAPRAAAVPPPPPRGAPTQPAVPPAPGLAAAAPQIDPITQFAPAGNVGVERGRGSDYARTIGDTVGGAIDALGNVGNAIQDKFPTSAEDVQRSITKIRGAIQKSELTEDEAREVAWIARNESTERLKALGFSNEEINRIRAYGERLPQEYGATPTRGDIRGGIDMSVTPFSGGQPSIEAGSRAP